MEWASDVVNAFQSAEDVDQCSGYCQIGSLAVKRNHEWFLSRMVLKLALILMVQIWGSL